MGGINNWVLGGCSGILSIGALFVASSVGHGTSYYAALAVFVVCVLFIFYLVRTGTKHE